MKRMTRRSTATLLLLFCSLTSCSLISPQAGRAQEDGVTDSGWPRQIQQGGNTITSTSHRSSDGTATNSSPVRQLQ